MTFQEMQEMYQGIVKRFNKIELQECMEDVTNENSSIF